MLHFQQHVQVAFYYTNFKYGVGGKPMWMLQQACLICHPSSFSTFDISGKVTLCGIHTIA